ncbi:MAG TPA: alanine racemase [Chitinophagaceae bacterium]
MKYTLDHIARIVGSPSKVAANPVEQLLLDSRKVYSPANSLFFALKGGRRDGHRFIAEAYQKGIRSFVISDAVDLSMYPGAGFVLVNDTLEALQQLAAHHRKQFTIPVIGITGSNGKTIVKEWLYQLLHQDYNIVRSPRSYNSQIGVPLSVWQMNERHTLAIFEAGISRPGEMEKLERIIQPTIGVLTNIGEAHSEGFTSVEQKEAEKRILFENATLPAALEITEIKRQSGHTTIHARKDKNSSEIITIEIPFSDEASLQNAVTCWQVMLMLGYENGVIRDRMQLLAPVNMRLELKKGINHCNIINDSYSADLSSLEIALNFLDQQKAGTQKTVILSDFLQSSLKDEELYTIIRENLTKHKIGRLIGIGEKVTAQFNQFRGNFSAEVELYDSTGDFIQQFRSSNFKEETILIKGARVFEFERIVQLLEQKVHQTVLEINLNAIAHNLKAYQALLAPSVKVMAMVKAFAYGSGGAEIAGILQYHKVDYLGVAYADEGIELRKAGITLPIMVMNPEESVFESLVEYNLEPDIYSFDLLYSFDAFLQAGGLQQFPVHFEIETGMNRLGFAIEEIERLAQWLQRTTSLKVQTIFSHLAASEDPEQDPFTFMQLEKLMNASAKLETAIGYPVLKHIGNSAAIIRHSSLQLDMVRLGIGLYGVDSAETGKLELQPVATLKSTIAQLKHLKAGESVSYNRKGIVKRNSVIATVRIGYADGFSRRLGNGTGKMWVRGKLAPVAGTVCMDMTMIDVTDIDNVQESDEVIIFGKELSLQQLAEWAGTIPYEIMTTISQRVKRVYFEE